jgi:hypothetical protein
VTRYRTVIEKNAQLATWSPSLIGGVLLYNRLLWLSVGFLALGTVWARFPMSVEVILLALTMLIGMVFQTIAGYYHYEFLLYFKDLYVVTFPQIIGLTLFALFVQTVVSNRFAGYGIMIGAFVLNDMSNQPK